ncbi:MAG: hypothetical protein Q8K65_05760 [Alphaproteobacteria bacterium]|nr:hypothetical protein [Alphaproteobacteria bacterium]
MGETTMALGFNNVSNKNREVVASTTEMRAQIITRLDAAYQRLNPANTFARVAGREETLLGSLVIGMLGWAAFGELLQVAFSGNEAAQDMLATANDPRLCAVLDGLCELADERCNKFRFSKSAMYPKGRKQDGMKSQPVNRKFNLVAANQNYRFKQDARNEISYMAEMLDMIDKMEKDGVSDMRVDTARPLYDTLKENVELQRRDKVVTRFSAPVRKFA